VQLTAANTLDQVDHLIDVLHELDDQFEFQPRTPDRAA
jgi:hypothetical protein